MVLQSGSAGKEKVIYQYRLLKRLRRSPIVTLFYSILLPAWLIIAYLKHGDADVILAAITAVIGCHLLYWAATTLLLGREPNSLQSSQRYGWTARRWPWIGYLPTAGVPFRQFRSIQLHLLMVGLFAAGSLSVWFPPWIAYTTVFVHLWMMLPRLGILIRLGRTATGGSILSISASEIDLHSP